MPERWPCLQTMSQLDRTVETRERRWFAVYTTSRHEKRVASHLEQRAIECYLPLYRAIRHWKGRPEVAVNLPLFPCYVFVRIGPDQRVPVLEVPGVLALVGGARSHGASLPEFEIEALRRGLDPERAEPHPLLSVGQRVRICRGALTGLEGILVRKKNNLRTVLTFESLMRSIALEIAISDLEPVQERPWPGVPSVATASAFA
jgi:transcription antitermination factor NusG